MGRVAGFPLDAQVAATLAHDDRTVTVAPLHDARHDGADLHEVRGRFGRAPPEDAPAPAVAVLSRNLEARDLLLFRLAVHDGRDQDHDAERRVVAPVRPGRLAAQLGRAAVGHGPRRPTQRLCVRFLQVSFRARSNAVLLTALERSCGTLRKECESLGRSRDRPSSRS